MSGSNFDDWNLTEQTFQSSSASSVKSKNLQISTLFLFTVIALVFVGLACVYSASYPLAQRNGYNGLKYLTEQLIYVGIGIVVGTGFLFVPKKIIQPLSYILMLCCLVVFCVNIMEPNAIISSEVSMHLISFVSILFFASFFHNNENRVNRLRELAIPVICVVTMVFFILHIKNATFAFVVFLISVVMFACGGVGLGGVLLLLLFAIVPTVCYIFSNGNALNGLLNLIVPGLSQENYKLSQGFMRLQAINSAGFFGKGLGMGQSKFGLIEGIKDSFIFCNVCEETGFAGAFAIILLFVAFSFFGYKCARRLRKLDLYGSNVITGLVTHILITFFINIFSCFNVLPIQGVSLPFISSSPSTVVFVAESLLIYKLVRLNGEEDE